MMHLAAVGDIYEGPGLTGHVIGSLNAPSSTLCGLRTAAYHGAPRESHESCKVCMRLLLGRTSQVVPISF